MSTTLIDTSDYYRRHAKWIEAGCPRRLCDNPPARRPRNLRDVYRTEGGHRIHESYQDGKLLSVTRTLITQPEAAAV